MMTEEEWRAYRVTCPHCLRPAMPHDPIEASAAVNGDDIHHCTCGQDYTHTESWKAYRRRCWEAAGSQRLPSTRR